VLEATQSNPSKQRGPKQVEGTQASRRDPREQRGPKGAEGTQASSVSSLRTSTATPKAEAQQRVQDARAAGCVLHVHAAAHTLRQEGDGHASGAPGRLTTPSWQRLCATCKGLRPSWLPAARPTSLPPGLRAPSLRAVCTCSCFVCASASAGACEPAPPPLLPPANLWLCSAPCRWLSRAAAGIPAAAAAPLLLLWLRGAAPSGSSTPLLECSGESLRDAQPREERKSGV